MRQKPWNVNKSPSYSNDLLDLSKINNQFTEKGKSFPLWNFESCSSCQLERPTICPEIEYQRYFEITKLRKFYNQICKTYLYQDAPNESFNRWLFIQLSTPSNKKIDVLLSDPSLAIKSNVLKKELQNNLPASSYVKYYIRDSSKDLKEFLIDYKNRSKLWLIHIKQNIESQELYEEVLIEVERCFQEINEFINSYRTAEELLNYIKIISNRLQLIIADLVDDLLDLICMNLKNEANTIVINLHSIDISKSSNVRIDKTKDFLEVCYKSDKLLISKVHWIKLLTLYKNHNKIFVQKDFEKCLYVLLRRYETFFGNTEKKEGVQMHAAALPTTFQYLKNNFGVEQENFASPLNCYFGKFNSAFPDIDEYFGSVGSFFDFNPIEGSFETGPPYTEEVMHRMAIHIENILNASDKPLSFVIFVPNWINPPSPGLVHMDNSKFNRVNFIIKAKHHDYIIGNQHREKIFKRNWCLPFDTKVYILQNEAGNVKWNPTDKFVKGLKEKLYKPDTPEELLL